MTKFIVFGIATLTTVSSFASTYGCTAASSRDEQLLEEINPTSFDLNSKILKVDDSMKIYSSKGFEYDVEITTPGTAMILADADSVELNCTQVGN